MSVVSIIRFSVQGVFHKMPLLKTTRHVQHRALTLSTKLPYTLHCIMSWHKVATSKHMNKKEAGDWLCTVGIHSSLTMSGDLIMVHICVSGTHLRSGFRGPHTEPSTVCPWKSLNFRTLPLRCASGLNTFWKLHIFLGFVSRIGNSGWSCIRLLPPTISSSWWWLLSF